MSGSLKRLGPETSVREVMGTDPELPVGHTPRHTRGILLTQIGEVGIVIPPVTTPSCQVSNYLTVFYQGRTL